MQSAGLEGMYAIELVDRADVFLVVLHSSQGAFMLSLVKVHLEKAAASSWLLYIFCLFAFVLIATRTSVAAYCMHLCCLFSLEELCTFYFWRLFFYWYVEHYL